MNEFLFHYFYSFAHQSEFLDTFVQFIGSSFVYTVLPICCLVFLLIKAKEKMFWFSFWFLSLFFGWFIAHTIKEIARIPRPHIMFETILPLSSPGHFSFPSEHAAVFAALAVVVWYFSKTIGSIFIGLAFIVGLSRIVSGVHTPVDIIGGFVVGVLVAVCIAKLLRKIK